MWIAGLAGGDRACPDADQIHQAARSRADPAGAKANRQPRRSGRADRKGRVGVVAVRQYGEVDALVALVDAEAARDVGRRRVAGVARLARGDATAAHVGDRQRRSR